LNLTEDGRCQATAIDSQSQEVSHRYAAVDSILPSSVKFNGALSLPWSCMNFFVNTFPVDLPSSWFHLGYDVISELPF